MMPHGSGRVGFCLLIALCALSWSSDAAAQLAIGSGPGESPVVRVIDTATGTDRSFFPYGPDFRGGVRVALGDVTGDGVGDIITGPGPGGGPHVEVFDGVTLAVVASFYAYSPLFTGGVFVATGDVNRDGHADIVTGAGGGGAPHVRVFSGADLSELASFYAYDPVFEGGVSVAAGDVNGDGFTDIVTGVGPGGGPHVRVFSGATGAELTGFFAYDPLFAGGVNVAAGDVNNDGFADVITAAGPGGSAHVRVFDGATGVELIGYFAYDPVFTGGVVVTAGDWDNDGSIDVITGPGQGGGSHVKVFGGMDARALASFMAFSGGSGGAFVGASAEPAGRRPMIISSSARTFRAGSPDSYTVTASGFPAPTIARGGVSLPAGVTFVDNGNGTGTLSGTPAPGTGGTYAITFTATNTAGSSVPQAFTLTVNEEPAVTSPSGATFTAETFGSFTVTASGFPAPAISLATPSPPGPALPPKFPPWRFGLPGGVTFVDNRDGTGTLSGTPVAGSGGTWTVIASAVNATGPSVPQTFTLTVNEAPAVTSPSSRVFTEGTFGSFLVLTSGFPEPTIARGGVSLPAGLVFEDRGNGTGTLSGTPAAGTGGIYAISFTATNSLGSSVAQDFTLTVTEAPAVASAAALLPELLARSR